MSALQGGLCESLRRLSEAGARLWSLYGVVEEKLGFARSRESSVASNTAWLVSCDSSCAAAARAAESISESQGRVCIVGPLAPPGRRSCKAVIAAGDDSLEVAAEAGLKPSILVTDADGSPPFNPDTLGAVTFLHVHADNLHLARERLSRIPWGMAVATSQVPLPGCVVSPFGFADGDRAVLLAAALGARVIEVSGISLEPESLKHKVSGEYVKSVARLWGFTVHRVSRYHFTLKRLTLNQSQNHSQGEGDGNGGG